MASEEGEEVTGVIFQFSSEAVLFEFSLDGQTDQVKIEINIMYYLSNTYNTISSGPDWNG